MFWRHSKSDIKSLLTATLLLFSAYAFLIGQSWKNVLTEELYLTANSVGVYAGVEENEINTLVAELHEREKAIEARENAVISRVVVTDDTTLLFVTIMGAGLLGLILLNFYLDSRRRISFA